MSFTISEIIRVAVNLGASGDIAILRSSSILNPSVNLLAAIGIVQIAEANHPPRTQHRNKLRLEDW